MMGGGVQGKEKAWDFGVCDILLLQIPVFLLSNLVTVPEPGVAGIMGSRGRKLGTLGMKFCSSSLQESGPVLGNGWRWWWRRISLWGGGKI